MSRLCNTSRCRGGRNTKSMNNSPRVTQRSPHPNQFHDAPISTSSYHNIPTHTETYGHLIGQFLRPPQLRPAGFLFPSDPCVDHVSSGIQPRAASPVNFGPVAASLPGRGSGRALLRSLVVRSRYIIEGEDVSYLLVLHHLIIHNIFSEALYTSNNILNTTHHTQHTTATMKSTAAASTLALAASTLAQGPPRGSGPGGSQLSAFQSWTSANSLTSLPTATSDWSSFTSAHPLPSGLSSYASYFSNGVPSGWATATAAPNGWGPNGGGPGGPGGWSPNGGYGPFGPKGPQNGWGPWTSSGAWTQGPWTNWWGDNKCPDSTWSGKLYFLASRSSAHRFARLVLTG